ncbi:diacylglycerol kinase family lipid kinase [Lishizhenia sp.]|uniref:diacylglycerol/lipid kinase family protein n=1 Tax=Lishizhenia sp. TaxID=2497594 RepID=UPI00299E3DE2|nr:diacylglycerol kinase family lipid kinase [Lishizhenia sp.]MDX1446655.1 diacylglycerol kinase family lipid kinase [Lishizhenia sp.]
MSKSIRFIINPISGVGKKNKLPGHIEKYIDAQKFKTSIVYTQHRGHATALTKAAVEEGVDIVCAVGGDGSVHEIGTALIGTNVTLAILPCGSGNGFARHLKIPLQLVEALKCINEERYKVVDTAQANGKAFIGVAGFGFDAFIAQKFDEYHQRGLWSYIKLVVKSYFNYHPGKIEIAGKSYNDLLLCTVANGSQFGNGFCIAPQASVEDGELEVFMLKQFPFYAIPSLVWRFFNRAIDGSKYTQFISIKNVNLKLETAIFHLDGEPLEGERNIAVSVVPKSLNVIVGKKY